MSDATNDAISIDDLFAALGTTSAPSKGKSGKGSNKGSKGSKASKQAAAPAKTSRPVPARATDADADDVLNVMAALGISAPSPTRKPPADSSERAKRASQREEQIREQQIRSQQWRRELEEQQKRRRMQAEAQLLEEQEEPQVPQSAAPRGFADDQTQIAEPSFLNRRDGVEPMPHATAQPEAAAAVSAVQTAAPQAAPVAAEQQAQAMQTAQPVQEDQPMQPEGATLQPQPEAAPLSEGASAMAQPIAETPVEETIPAPAVRTAMPSAEAMDMPFDPERQVTIPLEDQQQPQEDAASTGVIQPLAEQGVTAEEALPSAPTQEIVEPARAASSIKPLEVAPEAPVEEPVRATTIQPLAEAPALAPAEPVQPAAPAMVAQPQLERSIVTSEPRPAAQPKKAPAPHKKEKKGVNKGNVVGVLLIIIALVCAALTVMLLTGTIDATTFSNMAATFGGQQQESTASTAASSSSSASAATSQESGTESHAVYQYVVRGTDGSTHRATETAAFGADGLLQQSSIVIDVTDEAQAQSLLEQLRADFGDSVVDSGIRDGEVYLTIDIDRDDLDVDAYTELLSSNMAEFRIVETGANDPA